MKTKKKHHNSYEYEGLKVENKDQKLEKRKLLDSILFTTMNTYIYNKTLTSTT